MEADCLHSIRGICADLEWPVILHVPNIGEAPEATENLAKCVPQGVVVVFPDSVGSLAVHQHFATGRKDVLVSHHSLTKEHPGYPRIGLDEWWGTSLEKLKANYPEESTPKISALVCGCAGDYLSIMQSGPIAMKTCKLIFTPVDTYSQGTRIRCDIKDLAKGWLEYRRWVFDDGREEVLLYNEGA